LVRRRAARRKAVWLSILTILLVASAGLAGWWLVHRPVPRLDGQVSAPGLHAPVEVLFDGFAIPHVYARETDDAWTVAGVLHARERLWQMEVYRRATAGRLAEVFGQPALRIDKRLVALGLRRAAAREWSDATPQIKNALERYAAGVNAVVASLDARRRPLEFQLLGVSPDRWTPIDSLAIGKLMAWRLAENRHGELVRGALSRRFGPQEAAQLMDAWPSNAPTIAASGGLAAPAPAVSPPEGVRPPQGAQADAKGGVRPPELRREVEKGVRPLGPPFGASARDVALGGDDQPLPPGLEWLSNLARPGGSNSWVLAGARTASGRPLLANDPHLAVEMPSIWYELHLVAAGLDVAGVTLPGSPFVIIGHNQKIAWGLTNSGADVQDFYVEDVDMGTRRYLFRGEWLPLDVERVEIGVRGARPVVHEIFRTHHGPLIATEVEWEDPPDLKAERGRVLPHPLALRWEAGSQGETAGAFEALNRAGSWTDFLAAARRFAAPSQNLVYADVAGNIGYVLSGQLPVRAGSDGSTPVSGWTGEHEWSGTIPADRLPAILNPPAGQIVTANAEIDRAWPGVMTRDWTAPFRTARIVSLLGSRTGLNLDASAAVQADTRSEAADRILAVAEIALRSPAAKRAEADGVTALERMRQWDRKVDGRPVAALYQAFERALWRRTFADEMDGRLFQQFVEYGLSERFVGVHAILDDPTLHWWDDIATLDRVETRDDVMLLSAADAIRTLRSRFGSEPNWSWDRLHALRFPHALGGGGFPLDWFFSRGPIAMVGDTATVRKSSVDVRRPYGVVDISSYRQILDVGAWDGSRAVNTTGQSGHPGSAHYFDQNLLWREGSYRPLAYSRAAVEKARVSRLLVVPS
jgi:penicillin G amidase